MKALIFRETGEPKRVLKLEEIPTPPLAPGEALVRVLLSPINASDLHMVRGRYGYQPELPASPGIEGVGIVEAVGPGVQGTLVGTRVVFVDTWNTWREQIMCPADKLVAVPDGLDVLAAATSYINPLTAWALTRSAHKLKEGDWLLQTAAASTVGKLVLQLAQKFRFKTINVIRRREQETIIRNLGGNEVHSRRRSQDTAAGIDRGQGCRTGDRLRGRGTWRRDCPQPRYRWDHACVRSPFQSSADGSCEIHHAAFRSAFDLFDSDGSRVVASALGAFPAAGRSAGSDERPADYVIDRSTHAASGCAVCTEGFPRGGTPSRW